MTDHDDVNDPTDPTLDAAGQRLRQQAPDGVASRQALAKVKARAGEPSPQRRSWWPALIGAGLAAAAVVGVIAIQTDNSDTLSPVQTNPEIEPTPTATSTPQPTTTLVPSTTGPEPTGASLIVENGCITVTTASGSATGCPQDDTELDHLEQRTFVADLDGPVLVTSGSADPLLSLSATVDTGDFASRCQWGDLAPRVPAGGLVEVVVCNDTGVMGLTTVPDAAADFSASYFTLPTGQMPDGADLGPGTPIDGLPRALAFTAPVANITTCSILLLPGRSGWKEACGFIHGLELGTALVQIDRNEGSAREIALGEDLYEISVDDSGLITSAQVLDAMAPSSGCSIDSANVLARAMPASSIVMGIGCINDTASLTTGSVLTQDGPPDGSIWLAQRDEAGIWTITDNGTGIEDFSFPIAPMAVWETWPASTVARFSSYWSAPIVAIAVQPTAGAFADELLATLGPLDTDPEWPMNEGLVEVQPAGLPLIVAQVDLGGDDSVVGAMFYVWLDEVFDDSGPIGWRASDVLAGDVCGRADSTGRELCI